MISRTCLQLFSQIDLFGKSVALSFDGNTKSKSRAGAWFTLIFIGVLVLIIYLLGQDLLDRQHPKTIMSEFFEENPSPMIISPETFNVGFGIQSPIDFDHYIDESIYTIETTRKQILRIAKEDGTVESKFINTPLLTEPCTKEHFGAYGPKFENIQLDKIFCIKKEQPEIEKVQIEGVFESPNYEYVEVKFKECNNLTSKVPCASRERLDEMLSGGWFASYFTNVAIEPKNYFYPNVVYRDSFFTTISNTYFKEISLFLSHIRVSTDSGWLTKEASIDNYISLANTRELTDFRSKGVLFSFIVRVAKIGQHYERSYIKVQDVLAQVNGIASGALLVFAILLMRYSNIKFYERLINELFEIKPLTKDYKKDKQNKKCPKTMNSRTTINEDNNHYSKKGEGSRGSLIELNTQKGSYAFFAPTEGAEQKTLSKQKVSVSRAQKSVPRKHNSYIWNK